MDERKVENERAQNRREHEDEEYMHKIFIAAGTTLAMACLKRILVLFFVEQWRTKVFLILNLLLLAILFTSIHSSPGETDREFDDDKSETKVKKCGSSAEDNKPHEDDDDDDEEKEEEEGQKLCRRREDHARKQQHEEVKVDIEVQKLSKDELNERVEAFIAMFRQHLVSDARKSRNHFISSSKQRELFHYQKALNVTISSNSSVGIKV